MRITLPLLFFIISAITLSAATTPDVSPVAPPTTTRVIGTVTAPLMRVNGLPAVRVSINGSQPYPFVIDWAANLLAIGPERVQDLKLTNVGTDEMGNVMVRVSDLSIGDAHFLGMTAAADLFLNGHDEAGVLGVNVFRDVTFTIDFKRNSVAISLQGLPPANGRDILAYQPSEGGAPSLWVTICKTRVQVNIDTAAPAALRLPRSMMDTLGCKHKALLTDDVAGAQAGPSAVTDAHVEGDLVVGSVVVKRPIVRFGDGPQCFVGLGVLDALTVSLDQRHRLIRLTK
jgi:hypothetical protein